MVARTQSGVSVGTLSGPSASTAAAAELRRRREEGGLGGGVDGADSEERLIVGSNGVGRRGTLHGVGGCQGVDRAVRRPDGEGGVEGVDLVGKRMEPERACLTIFLPKDVCRLLRLRRLLLVHRPQVGPSLRARSGTMQSCGRTTHAGEELVGAAGVDLDRAHPLPHVHGSEPVAARA